tara:strand:+ start:408 stop:725 length:318 start_codon:yes stop_codon:yes gene_type:complete
MTLAIEEKEFEAIVKNIRSTYNELTTANIMNVVLMSMVTLEKYKMLSGNQKKQTVIDILTFIVDETHQNDEFDIIIKALIPSVIDTVIEADKGKLKIKKSFLCCF